MSLYYLKNLVGFFFVGLHILAISLCYIMLSTEMSRIDFNTIVFIVSPVAGVYALAYLRDTARNMFGAPEGDSRLVQMPFALLCCVFSLFFGGYVVWTIYSFKGTGNDPDELKLSLAVVETFAGGFIGLIFETLFGFKPISDQQVNTTTSHVGGTGPSGSPPPAAD